MHKIFQTTKKIFVGTNTLAMATMSASAKYAAHFAKLTACVCALALSSFSGLQAQSAENPRWADKKADDAKIERIDASTQDKLHDTFTKVLMSLDDAEQQKFAAAMATISVIVAEDKSEDTQKKLYKIVHEKSAEEIIAAARKLTPYIKKYSNIIDGTSEDTFNRSVGQVMVSLPLEQQGKFSEAVAKLMYQAQKDKIPPQNFRKKLDAKTADEIIWLAERISMPFSISNADSATHTSVAPLSKEQAEKLKKEFGENENAKNGEQQKKEQSLNINLSPNSLIK